MTSQNKKYIYWPLIAVIAFLGVFSTYLYAQANELKNTVENNYNRAFHELVSYVDDIDVLLQKNMLSSDASQMSTIASELFRNTTAAKACLGQLPISEVLLEDTEKFLSQIGDFTYLLSQKVIKSKDITEDEYKTLQSLSEYATKLNDNLLKMQQDIYNGTISFGTINKTSPKYFEKNAQASNGDILSNFENVEKEFQEYPSLIYDGPFSNHLENIEPKMLKNTKKITKEEGLNIAKEFLNDKGINLTFSGESENSFINSYSYSSSHDDRQIYISISKQGGYPVFFLDTKNVDKINLNVKDAIDYAKRFLNEKGYYSLKESYYDMSNGIATINFSYQQGDVVCYSDLIKVKVALDDGEIIGMESHGYLMNHTHRDIDTPKITQIDAKNKVNSHLNIDNISLALIPKESKREILCYEVKGNYNDKNFLIYINAKTGEEEQILMLLESENGILTI